MDYSLSCELRTSLLAQAWPIISRRTPCVNTYGKKRCTFFISESVVHMDYKVSHSPNSHKKVGQSEILIQSRLSQLSQLSYCFLLIYIYIYRGFYLVHPVCLTNTQLFYEIFRKHNFAWSFGTVGTVGLTMPDWAGQLPNPFWDSWDTHAHKYITGIGRGLVVQMDYTFSDRHTHAHTQVTGIENARRKKTRPIKVGLKS